MDWCAEREEGIGLTPYWISTAMTRKRYIAAVIGLIYLVSATQAAQCPRKLVAAIPSPLEHSTSKEPDDITRFLEEVITGLLEKSEVSPIIQHTPYKRALHYAENLGAQVVIVSDDSLGEVRNSFLSVPLMKLHVVQYKGKASTADSTAGKVGILRGFPMPQSLVADEQRIQRTIGYHSLFGMLAANRVSTAIAVRPTSDVFLKANPHLNEQIESPEFIESRMMSIHFSRELDAGCLKVLQGNSQRYGNELLRRAFSKHMSYLNIADFSLDVSSQGYPPK